MIRIVCEKCKNAYLQKTKDSLTCPSCGTVYPPEAENLLLGVQYYNEKSYSEAADYLMKALVADSENYKALFYKGLCDGFMFDEDTLSLSDTYLKLETAFDYIPDDEFDSYLTLAHSEAMLLEKSIVENHVNMFEAADAERIKKEVAFILKIQEEAASFRKRLAEFSDAYNERNAKKVLVNFSKRSYVYPELAADVGERKYQKIKDDIATHTVFTGILSSDIRNLEIYYRCIVMFFDKSKDKYNFLMENADKFQELSGILETGNYASSAQSAKTTAEKLKITAYSFFEDSLKEHEETEDVSAQAVTVIEPKPEEEPAKEDNEALTDIVSNSVLDTAEINTEDENAETAEDITAEVAKDEEEAPEEVAETQEEAATDTEAEDSADEPEDATAEESIEEAAENEAADEISAEATEAKAEAVTEEAAEPVEEADTADNSENETAVEEEAESSEEQAEKEVSEVAGLKSIADEMAVSAVIEIPADDKAAEEAETAEEPEKATEEQPKENEINAEKADDTASENKAAAEENTKEETAADDDENKEPETTLKPRKKNKHVLLKLLILLLIVLLGLAGYKYIPGYIDSFNYKKAASLAAENKYSEAVSIYKKLGNYSDSADKASENSYLNAIALTEAKKFAEARVIFEELGEYKDSVVKVQLCSYEEAKAELEAGKFDDAQKLFKSLGDYGDSADMIKECSYEKALSLIESKKYSDAITILSKIASYSDSKVKINEAKFAYVADNFDAKDKLTVKYLKELAKAKYKNSADLQKELLGDTAVAETESIKVFVNTSATDLKTSVNEVDNTTEMYFHAVITDENYYDKQLTFTYKTQYNYSQSTTETVSKSSNSAYMIYPATPSSDYTVTFTLTAPDGTVLGTKTVTIN